MHNTCFRAVSSVYGRIDHILIVHIIDNEHSANLEVILNLYKSIPNHVKFFVYVAVQNHDLTASLPVSIPRTVKDFFASVRSNGEPDIRRCTLILNNENGETTSVGSWVQDYFFALESESGIPAFLEHIQFRHQSMYQGDAFIADVLASETDFFLKPFPYAFRGGNILVGDDYMLASKTMLTTNAEHYGKDEALVAEAFRCGFGLRHILWIDYDSAGVELGDLDMFITLGGKTMENNIEKELVFIGQVEPASVVGFGSDQVDAVVQRYNAVLDSVADNIEQPNEYNIPFKIERIPLVVERKGRDQERLRPYSNCLVEVYGRTKNVYIPCYTDSSSDTPYDDGAVLYRAMEYKAKKIFESYQFTVVPIQGDFVSTTNRRGALHCVTNVLKRSESGRTWHIPFSYQTLNYNGNTDGVSTAYLSDNRLT